MRGRVTIVHNRLTTMEIKMEKDSRNELVVEKVDARLLFGLKNCLRQCYVFVNKQGT